MIKVSPPQHESLKQINKAKSHKLGTCFMVISEAAVPENWNASPRLSLEHSSLLYVENKARSFK